MQYLIITLESVVSKLIAFTAPYLAFVLYLRFVPMGVLPYAFPAWFTMPVALTVLAYGIVIAVAWHAYALRRAA